METGIFTFNYPMEEKLSIEDVEAQVDAAGYTAMGIRIERSDCTVVSGMIGASDKINQSTVVKTTFPINGKCSMCTARIRKGAFSVEGVAEVAWNEKSGIWNAYS
ncbi:MAG: mercuric ion binding protein [Saprospiraceae bacterium]|jgi:mercuric ion binding protein